MNDTIFALASGAVRAGVAVVRVSGPAAADAISLLTRRDPPAPRQAAYRSLWAIDEQKIQCASVAEQQDVSDQPPQSLPFDRALVLWFPGPGSFTGEDVAEFHVHGGPAVVACLSRSLAALAGVRPADPGEFSRRAFVNGKMDLTAVEGIADLVAAETEAQLHQARRQMEGALGELYDGWRESLLLILAGWEAAIDFPDEDLPDDVSEAARERLRELRDGLADHLADGNRGERLRDGIRLAIVGPPNAGKSSLLNRLARREAAIVSPLAGTTRDVIEVHLDVAGFPVLVADTAGLREGGDAIETEGVARARRRAEDADIRLVVFDAAAYPQLDTGSRAWIDERALVLFNKSDLVSAELPDMVSDRPALALSARTGAGVSALMERLGELLARHWGPGQQPGLTRARHRAALEDTRDSLDRALAAPAVELAAEDLRLACRALGRITGAVNVEDVLDRIFREFCIGK